MPHAGNANDQGHACGIFVVGGLSRVAVFAQVVAVVAPDADDRVFPAPASSKALASRPTCALIYETQVAYPWINSRC